MRCVGVGLGMRCVGVGLGMHDFGMGLGMGLGMRCVGVGLGMHDFGMDLDVRCVGMNYFNGCDGFSRCRFRRHHRRRRTRAAEPRTIRAWSLETLPLSTRSRWSGATEAWSVRAG